MGECHSRGFDREDIMHWDVVHAIWAAILSKSMSWEIQRCQTLTCGALDAQQESWNRLASNVNNNLPSEAVRMVKFYYVQASYPPDFRRLSIQWENKCCIPTNNCTSLKMSWGSDKRSWIVYGHTNSRVITITSAGCHQVCRLISRVFPFYNFLKLPEMRKSDLHVGKDKTSIILIEKRNIYISRLKQWKHCRGGDCNTGTGHDPFEITKEQFDRRGSSTRVDGHSLNPFLTMFETTAIWRVKRYETSYQDWQRIRKRLQRKA